MVLWMIADVARDVLLFDTTNAMFQTWSPRYRPGTRKSLLISQIRIEALRSGSKLNVNFGQIIDIWDLPGLRTVTQIPIGKIENRGHEHGGNPESLKSHPETIGWGRGGNNSHWALSIASEHGLQQISLL